MKCNVRFKGIDYSDALVGYVDERFQRLEKYEIKPIFVNVTFSEVRHVRMVEVYVKGMLRPLRAKASNDSFHAALDSCMKKLERQLERQKSRVKDHRAYERTAEYLFEEQLRLEKEFIKKVA